MAAVRAGGRGALSRARLGARLPVLLLGRVAKPVALLLAVFVGGSLGFYILGYIEGHDWSLLDCAYFATITLTTVGYEDSLGANGTVAGRIFTMFLIVTGMGTAVYSISTLTAFIVEGYVGALFREARMDRRVAETSDHTIICGAGRTGRHILDEHLKADRKFVIIDENEERLQYLVEEHGDRLMYVIGDATDQEVLDRAGLSRARSLVACLHSDQENVYLVVTARYARRDLTIVAKCLDHDAVGKFEAAGATFVVSPTFIGGMRMASQVIRPNVVTFLDTMLTEKGDARVSEVVVQHGSEIAGKSIAEAQLVQKVGLLIVALRHEGQDAFTYSPHGGHVLEPGCIVVVIGPRGQVQFLEKLAQRAA